MLAEIVKYVLGQTL